MESAMFCNLNAGFLFGTKIPKPLQLVKGGGADLWPYSQTSTSIVSLSEEEIREQSGHQKQREHWVRILWKPVLAAASSLTNSYFKAKEFLKTRI